ncbi:aldo/keto reductase family oxidoreductase [Clostridium pasteurianum DSM 525 = ATCC 6013]|uniref:Aldo/keto reductase family oxidoreductase n=1 Tax=Clostridium pasteurianum DSM 525 = ATCC 6013 TaxID=1262449 RepID=A0A0H3IZZ2_CLOPA|nr:aldo/keto reductase [Clostridium pasteurianum]AJA47121.1 aldo/keto reductase family oxidoreductase [Clostridium pasteurianum DSM 525 = ATCC 6013]AJA51109.1 aldo/keto reductase family oxidoreductase [Clostridium pasteurianum DSM 525 = ATCC 6013]AOZ74483.1 glyoxal reductase [Clostridium pasteurianum DSM 525 = ATCC 6013]AOZ78280.1 glyoxal reductase [Clostridium pasteurianum]ELP59490.1 2,5-diketo-D-gluconic acid reductase [Clostridium pasteurianum DSM 525 = ATCC 6013]
MVKSINDTTTLNNGVKMPWLGLGVFRVENGPEVVNAVKEAIVQGYRSIDGAAIYGNEETMGKGIAEGIKAAGISREDLFITSKLWNADQGYESGLKAYEESLKKLGLDYLDLYLIHWPVKGKYKEAWKALETIYKEGRVKAIGVSNFQIHHLEDLLKDSEIAPTVNQVEYHPRLTQKPLQKFCKEKGIQLEAWSPLMVGKLFDNEVLKEIADAHNKSIAQIILRWDLQNEVVTIPKSTNKGRIKENSEIFDFELSKEELEKIDSLNQDLRVGPDPDNFDF